ncbi:MAG: DUF262 domain-containing protein [Chlorobiaceae bacterium]
MEMGVNTISEHIREVGHMSVMREATATDVGLNTERQIQIVLQEIEVRGGVATSQQLYEAIEFQMPSDTTLSEQGQDTLRSLISRDATTRGLVEPYDATRPGWRITADGRAYLDESQAELGVEQEEMLPDEAERPSPIPIVKSEVQPFDSSNVRIDQRLMSVFEVMRKIERNDINLQPDFQRHVVWNPTRQSRLIESILLRIPLPTFYLDATREDTWLVVDGLQRLTTLKRFCFEPKLLEKEEQKPLVLANMEFLTELEGKTFHEIPRSMQRLIEDTVLNLYIIRPETSPKVKFTIFSRVNTGGLVLMPQEIRHALFQGRATSFLAELAQFPEFLSATTSSISPLRMDDRECVLRFLAFHLIDYTQYGRREQRDRSGRVIQQNLDGFLSEAMERLNALGKANDDQRLSELSAAFRRAMVNAQAIFGNQAFRKMYKRGAKRTQISKPLFEVWSVLLGQYDLTVLQGKREEIIDGFISLMNQVDFNKAVSLGTGSAKSVYTRFERVDTLLQEIVG